MKKYTIIFISCFLILKCNSAFCQIPEKLTDKHFLDAGYGIGQTNWYSSMSNSQLYDKQGTIIKSGDIKLKAKNSTSLFHFDVSFPVARVRAGFGMCFEQIYLDKITVKSATGNGDNYIVFNETFTFEKLYVLLEVPFKPESVNKLSFSAKGNLGYFNYSGIQSLNFFGGDGVAQTFFMTVGIMGNLRIYPRLYAYLYPNFEYMDFKNANSSNNGQVNHKIITTAITGGIRFDVSAE